MKRILLIFCMAIIVLTGCATTKPQNIFYPVETKSENSGLDIIPFFSNGRAIAKLETDSILFLTCVEALGRSGNLPGNGSNNIQIWVLIKNKYDNPFLFAPMEHIIFMCKNTTKDELVSLRPLSPNLISAKIENEKNALMAFQFIGGVLKTISTSATTVDYSDGTQAVVNDQLDKQEAVMDKTVQGMERTASLYDTYKSSIFKGILKKNTVFPDQSISGYVYIQVPWNTYSDLNGEAIVQSNSARYRAGNERKKYDLYTLWITLPSGPVHIDFTLAPGE